MYSIHTVGKEYYARKNIRTIYRELEREILEFTPSLSRRPGRISENRIMNVVPKGRRLSPYLYMYTKKGLGGADSLTARFRRLALLMAASRNTQHYKKKLPMRDAIDRIPSPSKIVSEYLGGTRSRI